MAAVQIATTSIASQLASPPRPRPPSARDAERSLRLLPQAAPPPQDMPERDPLAQLREGREQSSHPRMKIESNLDPFHGKKIRLILI